MDELRVGAKTTTPGVLLLKSIKSIAQE
jgi:hypothetical protein